jgi:hypothetical protein
MFAGMDAVIEVEPLGGLVAICVGLPQLAAAGLQKVTLVDEVKLVPVTVMGTAVEIPAVVLVGVTPVTVAVPMEKVCVPDVAPVAVSVTDTAAEPDVVSRLLEIVTVSEVAELNVTGEGWLVTPLKTQFTWEVVAGKFAPVRFRDTELLWPATAEVGEIDVRVGPALMVKFFVAETTLLMVSFTAMVAVAADVPNKLTGIETVIDEAVFPEFGMIWVVVPFNVKLTNAPVVGKFVPAIVIVTGEDCPVVPEVGEMVLITGGARMLKFSVLERTLLTVSVTATVAVACVVKSLVSKVAMISVGVSFVMVG